jgi:hypothetical protein
MNTNGHEWWAENELKAQDIPALGNAQGLCQEMISTL